MGSSRTSSNSKSGRTPSASGVLRFHAARIPSACAPATSSRSELPTITAWEGVHAEVIKCALEHRRVWLEVADLNRDGDGVPLNVEIRFAKVAAEALTAEGAVGDDPEQKAAGAQCAEHFARSRVGFFATLGAGNVDRIEECGGFCVGEVEPYGAGSCAGGSGVVGLGEVAEAGLTHCRFEGIPAGAGSSARVIGVAADGAEEGLGAFGRDLAEHSRGRRRGSMPEGLADVEKDSANTHIVRRLRGLADWF